MPYNGLHQHSTFHTYCFYFIIYSIKINYFLQKVGQPPKTIFSEMSYFCAFPDLSRFFYLYPFGWPTFLYYISYATYVSFYLLFILKLTASKNINDGKTILWWGDKQTAKFSEAESTDYEYPLWQVSKRSKYLIFLYSTKILKEAEIFYWFPDK